MKRKGPDSSQLHTFATGILPVVASEGGLAEAEGGGPILGGDEDEFAL